MADQAEVLAAVIRVCDSQRFIQGPEVEALERELADTLGVAEAIGVSWGTDALLVSMMALGISAGDEVITSTYSFLRPPDASRGWARSPDWWISTRNLRSFARRGSGGPVAADEGDHPGPSLRLCEIWIR